MRDSNQNKVTPKGCMADIATTTLTWTYVGGVWGAFNPYPIEATKAGGKFIPLRPFSSLPSIGYYAGLFGSIALVKCTTSGTFALARNKLDVWNDLVGVAAVYSYASYLFRGSEKRIMWNNRCLAGIAIGSFVYANTST
ncbi:hypothetical protein ACHAWU_007783 [Discostella pseudostelligera]|uniref:Uncharacterized protein n=1 Tax=Discostella pseudostelligera TaxID=259834 RepID=A0ABD3MHK8_9STRA